MIETFVNIPIGPDAENRWMASWGEDPVFFSLETVKKIFNDHPDETDFKFNFNCDGGYVDEGLAIYDAMRTSGKNIHCNIEGGCHSMAVVMLLAAPLENRTANPNCRALIHNVRMEMWDNMTAKELEDAAEQARQMEQSIIDIYVDRTGQDREVLQSLMNEEKMRTASELLQYGFISAVNKYNTNSKPDSLHKSTHNTNPKKQSSMANKTKQQVLNEASSFLGKLKNLLGAAVNYDHADADGNVLFTTDAENDHLEVGMVASPDGTFTLAVATSEFPEGTVVIIADGVITEINEPQTEEGGDSELDAANARIAELETALNEAQETISDLMAQVSSNYNPKNARSSFAPAAKPEVEDSKNEIRKRYGLKTQED